MTGKRTSPTRKKTCTKCSTTPNGLRRCSRAPSRSPSSRPNWPRACAARGLQKAPTKQLVSLRLDQDVIAHFKAGGLDWQTRINDVLRDARTDGTRRKA